MLAAFLTVLLVLEGNTIVLVTRPYADMYQCERNAAIVLKYNPDVEVSCELRRVPL